MLSWELNTSIQIEVLDEIYLHFILVVSAWRSENSVVLTGCSSANAQQFLVTLVAQTPIVTYDCLFIRRYITPGFLNGFLTGLHCSQDMAVNPNSSTVPVTRTETCSKLRQACCEGSTLLATLSFLPGA